jgi:hypothetical protein
MSTKTTLVGKPLPSAITKEIIQRVSPETLRLLIRTYSAASVNDVLFGRKPQ